MLLCPWDSPGKKTGAGCHFFLQGIFPTQGSNPCLMTLVLAGGFFTTSATWEAQLALIGLKSIQFSSFQVLTRVLLFVTPWTAARQASLSITNAQNLLKLMSIESLMPSNHLILCRSLLLPPSVFPSIRLFSSESVLHIRWPKYWSFSISPSNDF